MAAKLPNAPLTEVVFDLRWALQGPSDMPIALRIDPGYHVLADAFGREVAKDGFSFQREKPGIDANFVVGQSIRLQFLEGEDNPFPMFQIGPGVFASNDATDYEWTKFKRRTLKGIGHLLRSYPDLAKFPFRPIHLELRYINSFDPDLIGYRDLLKFINNHTSLSIGIPKRVIGPRCEDAKDGNIVLEYPVSNRKDTVFSFQLSTGYVGEHSTILLFSKVISRSQELKIGQGNKVTSRAIGRWLEDAHSVTSPFFLSFVNKRLMSKFQKQGSKKG